MPTRGGDTPPTARRVTVVTGASRGVGKGVALGLGEAGATVYVTGRSLEAGDDPRGPLTRPAAEIDERGGVGFAVRCDHPGRAAAALAADPAVIDKTGQTLKAADLAGEHGFADDSPDGPD